MQDNFLPYEWNERKNLPVSPEEIFRVLTRLFYVYDRLFTEIINGIYSSKNIIISKFLTI